MSVTLNTLETTVIASFEARRGKLYDALRALNALTLIDVARGSVPDDFTERELATLVWNSVETQLEKELMQQFRFAYVQGMARRKFKNLEGVTQALELLIPEFIEEFETRSRNGDLERRGGLLRYLTGIREIGSIEGLMGFCRESLLFAYLNLDDDPGDSSLEKRLTALSDSLPEV